MLVEAGIFIGICLVGIALSVYRTVGKMVASPLWPVRGIYWFLLKRFLMLNRPIWTQNASKLYRQTA
jgi:hypothetical protein